MRNIIKHFNMNRGIQLARAVCSIRAGNLSRNGLQITARYNRHNNITSQNTLFRRFNSTKNNTANFKVEDPQLMIAFTCKKCDTRSSHTFSKQAYTKGTVAIQCPGCKNRHLIADNLNIFKDLKFSLEDILKAKGESISTSTEDLVFDDIPESLKNMIGHHAKDAPEEYTKKNIVSSNELPKGKK